MCITRGAPNYIIVPMIMALGNLMLDGKILVASQ